MFEVRIFLETSLKGPVRTGTKEGWSAAVLEYKKKNEEIVTRKVFVFEGETTYHRSILLAMRESLKVLNKECVLEIRTDATYLCNNCKNGNLEMWKINGWKNTKEEKVKNWELWRDISAELDKHEVEFIRVRRHEYSDWMRDRAKERLKKLGNVESTVIERELE